MSMKLLGEHFDIHGGGLDLVFPHHENEVAQSESLLRQTVRHVLDAQRPAHQGGPEDQQVRPRDRWSRCATLLDRHDPDTIRALLLSSHYRRPIDYSNERLDEIERALQGFRNLFERFERINAGESFQSLDPPGRRDEPLPGPAPAGEVLELRGRFLDAMDDDFNTGEALGVLFELARRLNRQANENKLESSSPDPDSLAAFRNGMTVLARVNGHPRTLREGSCRSIRCRVTP